MYHLIMINSGKTILPLTQVEVPDRKSICPNRPRRKVSMSRLSCVQNFSCFHRAFKSPHVQTFVRSKLSMSRLSCVPKENSCAPKLIICAFMSRLSCVQKTLYPDFRAFKIVYVQTFVRSKGKFVRSKIDNLCVHVQTIVSSKGLMSRLSCVQKCLCSLLCVPYQNRPLQNWYSVRFCRAYPAFKRLYVETLVLSKWPKSRLLSVPNLNSRTKTYNYHKNYYFFNLSFFYLFLVDFSPIVLIFGGQAPL